jgi:hypothetical protein
MELERASGEFTLVKEVRRLCCTWLMKDRVARPSPWRPVNLPNDECVGNEEAAKAF